MHLIWVPFVVSYLISPARIPGGSHGHRIAVQRSCREQGQWIEPWELA